MKTSRFTPSAASRRVWKFSVSPPSNRMIATAMEIIGMWNGPMSRTGSKRPRIGPTMSPAASMSTIAGRRSSQASHCEPTPSAPTSATAATGSSPPAAELTAMPVLLRSIEGDLKPAPPKETPRRIARVGALC